MTIRHLIVGLGLTGALAAPTFADEIEVLARGPVHEAYAEPSEREPKPTPVVPKEPPKPIEELPPDQKPEGDNVQWLPGYWAWDEDKNDFLWVSGFWRVPPPGRSWMPGSWQRAGDGWQWAGGFWAEAKGGKAEVEYLPPPPAPLDQDGATTPAPSDNHTYVTGSWVYRDRYVWRPGYWIEHRPNWVWTSAHYRWTPAGCVYIDGYWDYPLASRGVLFAPAYIPPVVYSSPTFVYTPTVVVREECLYGAFFARRGYGCYYFGDYFAPRYASIGFTAWSGHVSASVRIGGWCDPLFNYYRCGYRHDPFWRHGCVDLYVGRYRGDYGRPPVTLVQQNTVINNITNNKTVIKNTTVNNTQMLTSIRNQDRVGNLNIRKVSDSVVRSDAAAAREIRATASRRVDQETRLSAATRPGRPQVPQRATLEVPQRPTAARPAGEVPRPGAALARPAPGAPRPTAAGNPDPRPSAAARPKADPETARPTAPRPTVAQPKSDPRPAVRPEVARPNPKSATVDPAPRPTVAQPKPEPRPESTRPTPKPTAEPAPRIAPRQIPTTDPRPVARPAPRAEPKSAPAAVAPRPVDRPTAAPRVESKPAPRPAARPESRPAPAKKESSGKKPATMSAARPAQPQVYRAAKPDVSRAPAAKSSSVRPAARPQSAARSAPKKPPTVNRVAPRPQSSVRSAPKAPAAVKRAAPRPQPAARSTPRAPAVQRSAPRPQPSVRSAPKAAPAKARPAASSTSKTTKDRNKK